MAVQLCRTLRAGDYPGPTQAPGGPLFAGDGGEATILEHLRGAFAAARRTIYIENQHPGEASLLELLAAALARGVRVVMIAPGEPMHAIQRAALEVAALGDDRDAHRYGPTFRRLAALGEHPGFTLAALARSDASASGGWTHREIYTHAKLCVVDGAWATLGSANLVDLSLTADHSELNASLWGSETCLPLLRRLVAEHTGVDARSDLEALDAVARSARGSRDSVLRGGPVLVGCYAVDPARYGQDPPITRVT